MTREEYYALAERGQFMGQRVELIDGEVIPGPRISSPQQQAVTRTDYALRPCFPVDQYWIRTQMPLNCPPKSAPEPDVAVVEGACEASRATPETALLVVEVSDTTLLYDQTVKLATYARAGIADFWIVNLVQRQLEVYRRPIEQPAGRWEYGERSIFRPGEWVAPLAKGEAGVEVASLLPPGQ